MPTLSEAASLSILTEIHQNRPSGIISHGIVSGGAYIDYGDSNPTPAQDDGPVFWKHQRGNMDEEPEPDEVRADLVFEFIKTNMTENGLEELRVQAQTLGKLLVNARANGQVGFSDELVQRIAQVMKEQEFRARGYWQWFDRSTVKRFMDKTNVRLSFTDVERFPRPIPAEPAAIIRQLQEAKVFDELVILHMNPTGEQAVSFSERIKKKDPILFGVCRHNTERLFYITDWVDEVCDLTMDKLLDAIHIYDADFQLSTMAPVSEDTLQEALKLAGTRLDQLNAAKPASYREDLAVTAIEEQGFSWGLFKKVIGALWRSRSARRGRRGGIMVHTSSSGSAQGWRR